MEPFFFKSYDKIIGIACDTKTMKSEMIELYKINPEAINYHLSQGHLVMWLEYLGDMKTADKLRNINNYDDAIKSLKQRGGAKAKQKKS